MPRTYGDGLYGECYYGGTDVAHCVLEPLALACPVQQPSTDGPADRLAGVVPCVEGDC